MAVIDYIPDHYYLRKVVCSTIGHKYGEHRRLIDYTLTEAHYLVCDRCYCWVKEFADCVSQQDIGQNPEPLDWKATKKIIHKSDRFVPVI